MQDDLSLHPPQPSVCPGAGRELVSMCEDSSLSTLLPWEAEAGFPISKWVSF